MQFKCPQMTLQHPSFFQHSHCHAILRYSEDTTKDTDQVTDTFSQHAKRRLINAREYSKLPLAPISNWVVALQWFFRTRDSIKMATLIYANFQAKNVRFHSTADLKRDRALRFLLIAPNST